MTSWVAQTILDMCRSGQLAPATCSGEFLNGNKKAGKPGYVDIVMYKKDVLVWLMRDKLRIFHWNNDIKEAIRAMMKDNETYRHCA